MERIRQFIREKPWAGWLVALIILASAAVVIIRQNSSQDRFSPARMQEYVTIKYIDTGDEERIPRGRVDKMLRDQGGTLDPTKGLINPKTGQPTGFPYDKDDWEAWIKRINDDRAQYGGGGASTPAPKPGN